MATEELEGSEKAVLLDEEAPSDVALESASDEENYLSLPNPNEGGAGPPEDANPFTDVAQTGGVREASNPLVGEEDEGIYEGTLLDNSLENGDSMSDVAEL